MARKYFGTDGIRGRVGEYPMTVDFALRLAHRNIDLPLSFALRLACFSRKARAVDLR